MKNPEITVEKVLDAIGRKQFASEMGTHLQSVTRAGNDGLFPANWYIRCKQVCQSHGVPFSDDLFRWHHGNSGKQTAHSRGQVQPHSAATTPKPAPQPRSSSGNLTKAGGEVA